MSDCEMGQCSHGSECVVGGSTVTGIPVFLFRTPYTCTLYAQLVESGRHVSPGTVTCCQLLHTGTNMPSFGNSAFPTRYCQNELG